jgi:hypothetical protein
MAKREAEQKQIEQTVVQSVSAANIRHLYALLFIMFFNPSVNNGSNRRTFLSSHHFQANEPRTTLSLSLTVSDKKALKMMAAEKGTTIAAIIHA